MDAGAGDVFVGILYIITCIVILIYYIPCVMVMVSFPETRLNPSFMLLFHMGVCDFISVISEFLVGCWSMTGWAYQMSPLLNKFVGALGTCGFCWSVGLALTFALAANQCCISCSSTQLEDLLFSIQATKKWIRISYVYGFVWFVCWLSPFGSISYNPESFNFSLWHQYQIIIRLHWVCTAVFIVASSICYFYILFRVKFLNRILMPDCASDSERRKHRRLLKQIVTVGSFQLVMGICSIVLHETSDPPKYLWFINNYLLIINSGIKPYIFLTRNGLIRTKAQRLFHRKASIRPAAHHVALTASRSRSRSHDSSATHSAPGPAPVEQNNRAAPLAPDHQQSSLDSIVHPLSVVDLSGIDDLPRYSDVSRFPAARPGSSLF